MTNKEHFYAMAALKLKYDPNFDVNKFLEDDDREFGDK